MTKKIWVVVFLILFFIAGSYIYYIHSKISSNHPIDETATWKTYDSDLYGYEIKLPNEYKTERQIVTAGVPDIEAASLRFGDYFLSFEIFARDADFIMKDCLKDLY